MRQAFGNLKMASWLVVSIFLWYVSLRVLMAFTAEVRQSLVTGLYPSQDHVRLKEMVGQKASEKINAITAAASATVVSWEVKAANELLSESRALIKNFAKVEEIIFQGISLEDELNARTDVSRDRQENVMRLVQQVEERRERAEDGECVASDCISVQAATDLIKTRISTFSADRTGMVDYAMGPAGATILPFTSRTFHQSSKERGPYTAISPSSRLGECWVLQGSSGRLGVKLYQSVRISKISIEHAPRVLFLNGGISAPRTISVVGYPTGSIVRPNTDGDKLITSAIYELDGNEIQFFEVAEDFREVEYGAVSLLIEDNYGEPLFTCLYRFRVHGTPASTG